MLQDGDKGVIIQRDKQTYAIAPHLPCGVVSPDTLRTLADVADKYHVAALKITSAARIALVGIQEEQVDAVWADLGLAPGAAVGLCVRSVKACPGMTFCKRGQQDSLGIGMLMDQKYHGIQLPGKLKIGVSGCPNDCAETCIKDVALIGTAKGWKVMVGGNGGARPRLAQELAKDVSTEEALVIVDKVIQYYKAHADKKHRRVGVMVDEMGLDEFKKAVLAG
ncbi:MAG: NAD(P)/FAD-dependent oxidoreductase [Sedimentisphaerales bacterium]|nr:NAD(P)/FAD-dependent oxidoreductase [Sedimentisphaerales bacterium]